MATTQIKNGFDGGSDDQLLVNPDGSINVNTKAGGDNASVGPTGTTAPTSATEIAGINPEGNLTPVSVDDNGFVNVNGVSTISGPVTTEQAGLNTFQTSQYSITTIAIQLTPTPLANRSSMSLAVIAAPGVAVYVGNSSTVTVSTGYPLFNGNSIELDLTSSGQIWAITDTPTQTIAVLEIA